MSGGQNLMDDPSKAKCGAVGHLARPFTIYHLPITNHLLFTIYQSADEPLLMLALLGMISKGTRTGRWRKRAAIWNSCLLLKLKFQSKIVTDDKTYSNLNNGSCLWAIFEGYMTQPNGIFVWAKSWEFVLVSCVEIAQAHICHNQTEIWCET